MSYPIDPLVSLTRANGRLALRLAGITHAAIRDWVAVTTQVGQSALGAAAASSGDATAGTIASAPAPLSAITDALRSKAEQHHAETREALREWQAAWREACASGAWLPMVGGTTAPTDPAAPAELAAPAEAA